jgi:hypothetical protein
VKRVDEIGETSARKIKGPIAGQDNKWYLNDMGKIYGPMSWYEIKGMADRAQVTPYAQIRQENWPQWMPILYYTRVKTPKDLESEGVMPSRYDAIFYVGVFLYVLGVVIFIGQPFIGISLVVLSLIIEFTALYLESKYKRKTVAGSIGNAMAILWIVVQVFIMIFLIVYL